MRFVVIEGLDGSGKSTQLKLLRDYLKKAAIPFKAYGAELGDYESYEVEGILNSEQAVAGLAEPGGHLVDGGRGDDEDAEDRQQQEHGDDHERAAQQVEQQATALRALRARMQDLRVRLNGDSSVTSRNEPAPLAIRGRVARIVYGSWGSQAEAGGTFRDSWAVAAEQFPPVLDELRAVAAELGALEQALEAEGAPWTPSRIPDWTP